jgi:hypothetical protein
LKRTGALRTESRHGGFAERGRSQLASCDRKALWLCGRDGALPRTAHARQCSLPIIRDGEVSQILPWRHEPGPPGTWNFEQIQRHNPRDMSLRPASVVRRRERPAGNTRNKSCYIPRKQSVPGWRVHDALSRDAMTARGCAAASPRAAQAHGVAPPDEGCRRTFGLICVISAGGREITRGGHPGPFSCLAIPAPGPRGIIS